MRCPVCGCTLISIHALLAESDKIPYATSELILEFLSTLSLRRATALQPSKLQGSQYFYPRSPCGERLQTSKLYNLLINISIHALLAESDNMKMRVICTSVNFYPRSPCGERRNIRLFNSFAPSISIHALLAESDGVTVLGIQHKVGISIHALLAESDALRQLQSALRRNFYPRSPCGERRLLLILCPVSAPCISIHALLAESDPKAMCTIWECTSKFLSTLSLRRATLRTPQPASRSRIFLSTLSLRRATRGQNP